MGTAMSLDRRFCPLHRLLHVGRRVGTDDKRLFKGLAHAADCPDLGQLTLESKVALLGVHRPATQGLERNVELGELRSACSDLLFEGIALLLPM